MYILYRPDSGINLLIYYSTVEEVALFVSSLKAFKLFSGFADTAFFGVLYTCTIKMTS